MTSYENSDDISKKKQQEIEDKENEIEEHLDNVSLKDEKESKKEANAIGDDHE